MVSKAAKYQICVLEGVQQGSQQALRTAQAQTIGNSFDCDIYLHDDSEMVNQLEILPGRFNVTVTLVSGEAILDNKPMVVGQKCKLSADVPVRIGESLFVLKVCNKQIHADIPLIQSELAEPEPQDSMDQEHVVEAANELVGPEPGRISNLLSPRFLIVLIGFGLIGAVFAAWRSGPQPVETVATVHKQGMVAQAGVDAVDSKLGTKPDAADIENSVVDVFRTYGVKAKVSSSVAGIVRVSVHSADAQSVAAAQASAKADVYGLRKLIVDYDQPTVEKVTPVEKVVSKPVDQEIRMIVIGNPTYVVASNQSRYFEGSKLPTGHRVAEIKKGLVVVEKNGITTQLKL